MSLISDDGISEASSEEKDDSKKFTIDPREAEGLAKKTYLVKCIAEILNQLFKESESDMQLNKKNEGKLNNF